MRTTVERPGLGIGWGWVLIVSVVVGLGVAGSRTVEPAPLLAALGALPLALLVGLWGHARRERGWAEAFSVAFALRAGLALTLGFLFLAQDEVILHDIAREVPCCAWSVWSNQIRSGNGYALLLSAIYAITGPNIFVAKLLNAVIGSFLPFVARRAARGLWDDRVVADRAFWVTALLPALVLYSALNLKEMTVTLLLVATIAVLADRRLSITNKAVLGVLLVVVTYLIRGAWAAMPASALGYWALVLPERPWSWRSAGIRAASAAGVGLILLIPFGFIAEGVLAHTRERLFIGAYASFGTLQTAVGSVTQGLLDVSNPWSIRNIVVQVARAPFSPSPLAWLSSPSFSGFFDSMIGTSLYLVWPFAIIGLIVSRQRAIGLIALPAASLFFVVAMSLNLGLTISRHVIPLLAPLGILAAQGWDHRSRWRIIVYVWIAAAGAFSALYIFARF